MFVVTIVTALVGCDYLAPSVKIDGEWHKQALLQGHLSHWLEVSPTPNGYMNPVFTRRWRLIPKPSTTLTQQTRIIYIFAIGYQLSGDKRYLDAAVNGAEFLFRHFRDPVYGGWFQAVAPDGKVLDESKDTYGHAFAIFAMAHLYAVTQDARYRDAGLETWRVLRAKMRDAQGGFRISAPRNFDVVKDNRRQNPVMHLFEAMLALYVATGNEEALSGTDGIGNFVIYKLLQGKDDGSAYIEEWYDEKWQPAPDETGGYIDLGHQFEWAFLLSKAGTHGLDEMYPLVAQRIMDYAMKVGYDRKVGGSFNRSHGEGKVDPEKGFWQQAECLRALMHFVVIRDKTNLESSYEQTLNYVQNEWIDNVNGGWWMKPKSLCTQSDCPNEQPDAYHMTSLHSEGIELAAYQIKAKH
ncbi:MAG: AGE family epimerase/isomerase [Candidatus Methylumidiphilus sp.]